MGIRAGIVVILLTGALLLGGGVPGLGASPAHAAHSTCTWAPTHWHGGYQYTLVYHSGHRASYMVRLWGAFYVDMVRVNCRY